MKTSRRKEYQIEVLNSMSRTLTKWYGTDTTRFKDFWTAIKDWKKATKATDIEIIQRLTSIQKRYESVPPPTNWTSHHRNPYEDIPVDTSVMTVKPPPARAGACPKCHGLARTTYSKGQPQGSMGAKCVDRLNVTCMDGCGFFIVQ